jgi:MFS family permease
VVVDGLAPKPVLGSLLTRSGFLRLFIAGIASVAGFSVTEVCLVWIVYQATHSAWDIALYGLSGAAAAVAFSLIGGALVDRYDRRRLMLGANVFRAAALVSLLALLTLTGFSLVAILVTNLVFSALSTLFNPAENTYLPTLCAPDELPGANGLVRSSRSVAAFAGSGVAGALIVLIGPVPALGVDIVTLAASAGLIYTLPGNTPMLEALRTGVRQNVAAFLREIRGGIEWLWQHVAWLQLTVSAAFFNFFSSLYQTFLVFYATELIHGSALVFGGLLAATVAGSAVGSLLVGSVGAVRFAGKAWVLPYGAVSGGLLVLLAVLPNIAIALLALLLLGVAASFAGTAWLTAAQLMVPPHIQGRYFGIDGLGSWAIIPLAQVVGGILVGLLGVGETYLLIGVSWTLVGLLFLLPRSLRDLGYRAPPEILSDPS